MHLSQIFVNLDKPFEQFYNKKIVRNKTELIKFTRVVMEKFNAKATSHSSARIFFMWVRCC